jgi:hypothetical protein
VALAVAEPAPSVTLAIAEPAPSTDEIDYEPRMIPQRRQTRLPSIVGFVLIIILCFGLVGIRYISRHGAPFSQLSTYEVSLSQFQAQARDGGLAFRLDIADKPITITGTFTDCIDLGHQVAVHVVDGKEYRNFFVSINSDNARVAASLPYGCKIAVTVIFNKEGREPDVYLIERR